jgi:lipopolysaccharide export system protein LptA
MMIVLILALAIGGAPLPSAKPSAAPAPPPPAAAGAALNTGSYTVEGQNLEWNQRTGDFTIPKDVKFTQPGTDVTGDRATGNSIKRTATITGHVVLHNSKPIGSVVPVSSRNASSGEPQTLTADQLQIDGPAKMYVATGNVKFTQGSKTVTAERGSLDQLKHLLELNGHVHIEDGSTGQTMTAENVTYDTVNETVTASGKPFQIRAPAGSEPPAPATAVPTPKPKRK